MTLPFTGRWLLAPMEGVTEPCFRELVLERNPPGALGGAFTEFVRVVQHALPPRTLKRHLGERRFDAPVGLQLMGNDVAAVAETARRAIEAGAPLVDLNFGCPAKGALRGCAGAALLDDPGAVHRLVKTCADAVPPGRLTAKIRAGGEDDRRIEELARAVEDGGAALLTMHCRTRVEGYRPEAPWGRLQRAVAAVRIPVCGNGGIHSHRDLQRMLDETGCTYAMVGRAALGDPWIFSDHRATPREAAQFLLSYAETLMARVGARPKGAVARVKQLLHFWTAGRLVDDTSRQERLRERDPERILAWLRSEARDSESRLHPSPDSDMDREPVERA